MKHRILFTAAGSLAALRLGVVPLLASPDVGNTPEPEAAAVPTFNEQIAPLIHNNCSSCHRPGEAAPFSLISFEEVSKKAGTMKRVMNDRYMPPWHPEPGYGEFAHERRLSDADIALFNQWVEAGRPEGDPDKAPTPPTFPEGWQLGEPDLVLTMPAGFSVPADGPDLYRNFVLPLNLEEDKWVKAVELRPSARSVVHHVLFFLDDTGTARKLDGQDGQPGFRGMAFRRSGSLGGYIPGSATLPLPGDLALPLPKGSDLILSAHFHPSGKAEVEQTTVGIYFADKPSSKKIASIQVPPAFGRGMGIDIPAGEPNYKIEDTFTLPVDVDAISVGGHAHYICQEMKMTATLPDGTEKPLLYIADWDLDWQDRYYFKEPVRLPAGTVLRSELRYDNSEDNPDNPNYPPVRVRWGRESTDEMGSITLMVVPADDGDSLRLTMATARNQGAVLGKLASELRNGALLERLPQILNSMDANQDGNLQRDELPPRLQNRLFDRLNSDGNDFLDSDEMQTLHDFLDSLKARASGGETASVSPGNR